MSVHAVYRASNGRLLRWWVDANPKHIPLGKGEALIEMPDDVYLERAGDSDHVQAFVTAQTKLDPGDDDKFVELDDDGKPVRVRFVDPDTKETAKLKKLAKYVADEEAKKPRRGLGGI